MRKLLDRIRIYFGFFTEAEEDEAVAQAERNLHKRWAPYLKD